MSRLDLGDLGGDDSSGGMPKRTSESTEVSKSGKSMAGRVSGSDRSESEDQVRGIDK